MIYVIGSGPTGVACAAALVDAGAEVTLLDVGRRLEPERQADVTRLASVEPEAWEPQMVAPLTPSPFRAGGGSSALKLAFGSTFPYAGEEGDLGEQDGTVCVQSFARGGLSTVWGAAVLPCAVDEIADWPVKAEDFAPHYEALARLLGIAAGPDDLTPVFPLYGAPAPAPPLSRQAAALSAHLGRHRAALAERGFVFGRSRLALRFDNGGDPARRCRQVGLCLTGCPYGAIWSADDVLPLLAATGRFHYRGGWKVETITEHPGRDPVSVVARPVGGGEPRSFPAERVFLAAGVLSTLAIVLRSLGRYDEPVPVRYHPYFLLPGLARHPVAGVVSERLHTLAQLFIELRDARLSPHWIHMQLYTYSRTIAERLHGAVARLGPLGGLAERRLLGRLLVLQGYLPAESDVAIEARLVRNGAGGDALRLRGRLPHHVRGRIRGVVWRLSRNARRLGIVPLTPLLHVGRPGEGNHVGACFPMRARPGALETDVLGRLRGHDRIHVVDASVLPSLPATTLTYTAMANARRIALGALGRRA